MCKINCSGGCKDCAPDEHAFDAWYVNNYPEPQSSEHYHLLRRAFCAGYWAADTTTKIA